jgi:hypothetical protein
MTTKFIASICSLLFLNRILQKYLVRADKVQGVQVLSKLLLSLAVSSRSFLVTKSK